MNFGRRYDGALMHRKATRINGIAEVRIVVPWPIAPIGLEEIRVDGELQLVLFEEGGDRLRFVWIFQTLDWWSCEEPRARLLEVDSEDVGDHGPWSPV